MKTILNKNISDFLQINSLRERFRKKNILKTFLFIILLIFLIPKQIFCLPGFGIDPSWMLALNIAIKENLVFGRDFIFTYGPLGFLGTGLSIYTSKLLIVLFYLFIVFNGVYFIYYLFKRIEKRNDIIIITVILLLFGNFLFRVETVAIGLYFYFLFHLFHLLRHKNVLSYVIISICCILAFYIKVNTGFVVNVLLIIFIIYNIIFKKSSLKFNVVFLFVHLLVLYFLSFVLNTDFVLYVKNSIPIVNSYNDSMVIPSKRLEVYSVCMMIILALFIMVSSFKSIIKSHFELFLIANISLLCFILFKQGFVRADIHVNIFYSWILFVVLLAFLFTELEKFRTSIFSGLIIIVILVIASYRGPMALVENLILNTKAMFYKPNESISSNMKLPDKILKEIGNKSVDILGSEISYIYYNQLKYNPRPVIQSFCAYDKELITINSEKYNCPSAPDYVLFHFGSIDNRNPFWDEPLTYLSIFKNYNIIDTISQNNEIGSLILFKKTTKKKQVIDKIILDTLINFNSKVRIPHSDNLLYLTIDYEYTLLGKIRRTLFQPSLVQINLHNDNFTNSTYTLILPVMKSGVPINKKIVNFNEAFNFFNTNGRDNQDVLYFKLIGIEKWIKNPIKIRLTEYKIVN